MWPRCRLSSLRWKGVLLTVTVVQVVNVVLGGSSRREQFFVVDYPDPNANNRSWRAQFIIRNLLNQSEYNPTLRPHAGKDPVLVTTSLKIYSLSAVKEALMEFKAQFRFKQEWYDDRLAFNDTYFNQTDLLHLDRSQTLWIPDTFFQNEKDGHYHEFDQPNFYVAIQPNGHVIYDRRLTMTFACKMELRRYPMDQQICTIEFASYAYTEDDIIYIWRNEAPIELMQKAKSVLSNFQVIYYINSSCTSKTNTGTYSCLRVEFKLQRVFSFFLLQLYIPSCLLVAVSWVSYWIDWRAAAGRVPLAIVTLLTMITQSHAVNANLPPVSYAKAIDVWIGACVMFIFGSLIEYAFVNYTGIHDQRKKAEQEENRVLIPPTPASPAIPSARQVHETIFSSQLWPPLTPTTPQTTLTATPSPVAETANLIRRVGGTTGSGSVRSRRQLKSWSNNNNAFGQHFDAFRLAGHRSESIPLNGFHTDLAVHFEDISDRMRQKRRRRLFAVQMPHLCHMLRKRSRADRIDFVSRLLFPLLFGSFNIVYWSIYWFDVE